MSTQSECDRVLMVQAEFDGELDAAEAISLFTHERDCEQCRRARAQLIRSRGLVRSVPRYEMPAELRASFRRQLHGVAGTSAKSTPNKLLEATMGRWGGALAAAAALALVLMWPRAPDIRAQLVENHVRALQLESHLVDVVSTDHHTVKPWFAGKVSFAPSVKQLESDGYVLKGGRIDLVKGAPVAVLVYQAGRHLIDVYSWPAGSSADGVLQSSSFEGFNLRHWQENDLTVWCVSDLAADELDRFARRWRQ